MFYKLDSYTTGDIVAYQDEDGQRHMGRIVAVEGQKVSFTEKGLCLVNDWQLSEDGFYPTYAEESAGVTYPVQVEENAFFVLNDYRIDTGDSRIYGGIPKNRILGKVILVMRRRGF
jgi:signal peptidase I